MRIYSEFKSESSGYIMTVQIYGKLMTPTGYLYHFDFTVYFGRKIIYDFAYSSPPGYPDYIPLLDYIQKVS